MIAPNLQSRLVAATRTSGLMRMEPKAVLKAVLKVALKVRRQRVRPTAVGGINVPVSLPVSSSPNSVHMRNGS